MTSSNGIYQFGEWSLDPSERLFLHQGEAVPLTPKAFDTLLLLVQNAGHLVTKQEFAERVWPDAFVEDVALAQNVSHLRKILALSPSNPWVIETVPKRGYRLAGPIQLVPANGNRRSLPAEHRLSPTRLISSPIHDDQLPHSEENVVSTEVLVRETPTTTASATTTSRAARIASLLAAALALLALLSFAVLRYGRAVPVAGISGGYLHSGGRPGENRPAPQITPLISLPGEQSMPAFSPEGSRMAFVWQSPQTKKSGIYAVVVGTQSMLRLTSGANDICPTWSPDGRYVAFERNSQDKFSIYLAPALGGPERRVYSGIRSSWVGPEGLSFSPDGKVLAFAEWSAETRSSSIKLVSLEDSAVRSITSPPLGYHDAAPAFAPDGERVAFVRSTGPIFLDELYVLRLSGGEPVRLTFDHHRVFGPPVWTQDGQEILFASNRAGLKSLWRISASGGSPQPVLGPGPVADHPSISPAGELAYEYSVEDENLWRVELRDGIHGDPASALFSSKSSNLMPQFSPDGRRIAFEGDRSGYEEIWICDADGSDTAQVTKLERFSGTPRWSPDGRYLVFDSRREQHSGIYTVDVSDRSVRSIVTFADADSVVPSWSRDGQWIYFASDHASKTFHLWKVPVKGGSPVEVTKNNGFAAFESLDGAYVFYAKLSEPGIWRVPRGGGSESRFWPGPGPDNWGNWAVSKDAIYFIESKRGAKSVIERLDLETKRVSPVATLERPSFYGLTVSPGKSIVFSQRDREEHELVLTKLFR